MINRRGMVYRCTTNKEERENVTSYLSSLKTKAWRTRMKRGRGCTREINTNIFLYSLLHIKQPIHKQSSTTIGTATGVQYTAVDESYVYILSFDSLFITWNSRLRLSCFLYLNLSSKKPGIYKEIIYTVCKTFTKWFIWNKHKIKWK